MALAREAFEQRHDLDAAARVESARWLVGENDLAAVHQRTRDGYALLLAARELVRPMIESLAQPQRRQQRFGADGALGCRKPRIDAGHLDVLLRGLARQQVVALEHEAERFAAQPRETVRVEALNVAPRKQVSAALGRSRQPKIFINVDLPEPDWPTIATNSPG